MRKLEGKLAAITGGNSGIGLATAKLYAEQVNEQYEYMEKLLPAGRMGEAKEMASVAVFLASDDSSFMYGSEIQADGGMNQTRLQA